MSRLSVYLDQMAVSCQGIDSLPFPPPKVFTNAMLYNNDITSLIRDTEAHERALFSVPPRQTISDAAAAKASSESAGGTSSSGAATGRRRQTVFNVAAGEVTTGPPSARPSAAPRRQTAVAAVLGGDLHAQITRRGAVAGAAEAKDGTTGDVDINVLLRGAEKLCSVYALPGALERIPQLRQKYGQQSNTLAYYEAKVADQAQRLEEMNRGRRDADDDETDIRSRPSSRLSAVPPPADLTSEADLRREEEEVRELERRKKELQERLRTMDKDLGGLLRM